MCTLLQTLRGIHIYPQKFAEERESNIICHPQQLKASISQMGPTTYPSGYEMKMAVQKLFKLSEPKINILKVGYSAMANIIF